MTDFSNPVIDRSTTFLIVDDEPVGRLGLRLLLEKKLGFSVIGEATNGKEAVDLVSKLSPSVVFMDVSMPILDGISAVKQIREINSHAKIIMLTSVSDRETVLEAIESGANGYCLKQSSPEKFQLAVLAVTSGDLWLDGSLSSKLRNTQPSARSSKSSNSSNSSKQANLPKPAELPKVSDKTNQYQSLSTIEHQILTGMVDGLSEEELAIRLNLTRDTFKELQSQLMDKIAVLEVVARRNVPQTKLPEEIQGAGMICDACEKVFHAGMIRCPNDGFMLRIDLPDHLVGSTFVETYEILSRVGKGTGAAVYRAHHKFLNKPVAVKIIHSQHMLDLTMVQRFRYEAEIVSTLNHPNIISVLDFGISPDGLAYMIMDFINGCSLATVLEKQPLNRLELGEAIDIFHQLSDGLHYAHGKGLIHRDLKPQNVMIKADGAPLERVKIVDFGLTKPIIKNSRHPGFTAVGEVCGSPTYMSPEQCLGLPVDTTSDIYSLGCTMYECLVGVPPFNADNIPELMYQHIKLDPELPSSKLVGEAPVLNKIDSIILKALQKDPQERYRTVAALKNDLFELSRLMTSQ
ncbi:hypothetical protein BH11CYA1_BH11CYA1_21540 [soil metagenome]